MGPPSLEIESPHPSASTASNSDLASRPSQRARSPTKYIRDLRLSDIKIKVAAFGTPGAAFPADLKELWKDLLQIEERKGIMPAGMETLVESGCDDRPTRMTWFHRY